MVLSTSHTVYLDDYALTTNTPISVECNKDNYKNIYVVRNWDKQGVIFFFIGTNYKGSKEHHVWYPNGKMWSSYGTTILKALNGAIRDGWMYATNR